MSQSPDRDLMTLVREITTLAATTVSLMQGALEPGEAAAAAAARQLNQPVATPPLLASGPGRSESEPTMAERAAAARQLNQPVSANPLLDPGAFAADASNRLSSRDDWWAVINPEQHAAYRQAQEAFERLVPWLPDTPPLWDAYNAFISEMFDFVMVSYEAGVRHGAAYEHLRRAVVGDLRQCPACRGVGMSADEDRCPDCKGTGIVALQDEHT